MQSLRECLAEAEEKKVAIGHFNISNLETLWGIFNAARGLKVPVIIGVSEGERDFVGVRQAAALVKSFRDEFSYPIFLNADHSYSFDRVKETIAAGYDMAIFDGAKLPLEENIKITKECVDYAKASGRDVLVEGELGYIGSSSKVLTEIPAGAAVGDEALTTVVDALQFVKETLVDAFAPAVGNIHGMLAGAPDPRLNIERVKEIAAAVRLPLVLHGASGNSDEDIRAAIAAGVRIVHVNTELRVAYKKAVMKSLQENPDEVAPYKIMKEAVKAIEELVTKKLKTFNNIPGN